METATLDDGEVINVIDTPEMFKSSKGADQRLVDETLRSINTLANDGIHGFIMVYRIVQSLKLIFGEKILDHMIIVFTGGDDLEDMTFPEYLSTLPPSFQTILNLCGNKVVLFDNKSKEESQRRVQVQQLMSHIVPKWNEEEVGENGRTTASKVGHAIVEMIRAENGQVPKLNEEEAGENGQTTASKVGHIVGHIGLHMGVDAAAPALVAAAPYVVAAAATCTIM
ncbi:hypothetical protein MKW94_018030 [Papaver nudicaule]|uniref:AIG1-type G domain-containing protein n=1 Tax=Papaver nudicaule TaxID=74823 RepID=A0AA41UWQ5_PAPNU|nr:hypothetical protein [Papaver nudicaule]